MSRTYAELEIAVYRAQTEGYEVELRFSDPESEAEIPPERGTSSLDPSHLMTLRADPAAYGESLAETLFEGKPAAQSSLAPRLAEAGVSAVVAMQGKISMTTIEQAMPVFFKELLDDGQIDRALAVARAKVRERADFNALRLALEGLGTGRNPVLHTHQAAVRSLAIAPDGRTLASASEDGEIRLFDLGEPDKEATVVGPGLTEAGTSP